MKVAVVTGSNKGIGYFIVKGLCEKLKDAQVILTARNLDLGKGAVENLKALKCEPKLMQLDISDDGSVDKFVADIKKEYGGVDILVHNAGFAFKEAATDPFGVQAKETFKINYFATLKFADKMYPLIRPNGRIVYLGSFTAKMAYDKMTAERQKALTDVKEMTREQLDALAQEFISDADGGVEGATKKGWAPSAYGLSKAFVMMHCELEAKKATKDGNNVVVCSVCPGWCKTDIAGHENPPKTAEEGADTPLLTALAEDDKYHGKFVTERNIQAWY